MKIYEFNCPRAIGKSLYAKRILNMFPEETLILVPTVRIEKYIQTFIGNELKESIIAINSKNIETRLRGCEARIIVLDDVKSVLSEEEMKLLYEQLEIVTLHEDNSFVVSLYTTEDGNLLIARLAGEAE